MLTHFSDPLSPTRSQAGYSKTTEEVEKPETQLKHSLYEVMDTLGEHVASQIPYLRHVNGLDLAGLSRLGAALA